MSPGDRVTFKYDKRPTYGTVISCQFENSRNYIFVVWDKNPDHFQFYQGEIRLVRPEEEIEFPEEVK